MPPVPLVPLPMVGRRAITIIHYCTCMYMYEYKKPKCTCIIASYKLVCIYVRICSYGYFLLISEVQSFANKNGFQVSICHKWSSNFLLSTKVVLENLATTRLISTSSYSCIELTLPFYRSRVHVHIWLKSM